MKKIRIKLSGDAEKFYLKLKSEGMSCANIFGKALMSLELVKIGELVPPPNPEYRITFPGSQSPSSTKPPPAAYEH